MKETPTARAPEPRKVQQLFDRISRRYDRFNRGASLGLDLYWRARLVREVEAAARSRSVIADFGTGTADLIFKLQESENPWLRQSRYIGLDFSAGMLAQAAAKSAADPERGRGVFFVQAEGSSLPLASASVDVVVSGFVLRNVKKILYNVLREIGRVLVPGGQIYLLDMYAPESVWLRALHKVYLRTVLKVASRALLVEGDSGRYLADTILQFGSPAQMSGILEESGFKDVRFQTLNGGLAVLHRAYKPL